MELTRLGAMIRYSGVPSYLLEKTKSFDIMNATFPFMNCIIQDNYNNTVSISKEKQAEFYNKAHKIKGPLRIAVFSHSDLLWAQLAILKIYTKTAMRLMNKDDITNFMKWETIDDSFKEDEIIESLKSGYYPSPYMVIGDVKVSSNPMASSAKSAKIRYIINHYPNPLFIIFHGKTKAPYTYWIDEYGSRPSFMLRIDRPLGKTIRI